MIVMAIKTIKSWTMQSYYPENIEIREFIKSEFSCELSIVEIDNIRKEMGW